LTWTFLFAFHRSTQQKLSRFTEHRKENTEGSPNHLVD